MLVRLDELNSFSEYFSLFQQCLNQHLDIEECCFLSFEEDALKPLTKADLHVNGIPWALFETYFDQQKVVAIPHSLSEKKEFQQLTHMMLLRIGKNNPIGVILFRETEKWQEFFTL